MQLTAIERLVLPKMMMLLSLEASRHYWLHLYYFLKDAGWEVEVFNPVLSNIQGRANLRGRKSDKDDTINIAKVLRDGGYHPWHQSADQIAEYSTQKFSRLLAKCSS